MEGRQSEFPFFVNISWHPLLCKKQRRDGQGVAEKLQGIITHNDSDSYVLCD
jgi:hypothetical protein